MSKEVFILEAKNGLLVNNKAFIAFANSFKKDGKYLIEKSGTNKRSEQQNRYYFGIVVPLVQEGIKHLGTELTKQETHEFLKGKFNYQEISNKETGEYIQVPRSTTILNKEGFSEYIQKIQIFAAEFLNINVPDPGEQLTIEL